MPSPEHPVILASSRRFPRDRSPAVLVVGSASKLNISTVKVRTQHRRRLFKVIAVIMGLCAALLFAEVTLRVYVAVRGWTPNCYVTGLAFFAPDSHSGHTLQPGLRLKSSAYDVSVNEHGLRGESITHSKPADITRIAVLGGSSVFGYLVPNGQDSCCELQTILNKDRKRVEVLNSGVPGFNMTQCRHRYEHQVAPLDPDIVLLYMGWNDIPFLTADDPRKQDKTPPPASWLKRLTACSVTYGLLRFRLFPDEAPRFAPPSSKGGRVSETRITEAGAHGFRSDLLDLVESIRRSGATPVISTQVTASNSNCHNLDRYLGNSDAQIRANREIGQWITDTMRSTAHMENVLLIDCASELPCDPQILGDPIHLTRTGHKIVADLWAQTLAPLVSDPQDEMDSFTTENKSE